MGISNNLIPTEPLGMDFFLYLPFYSPPPSFLAWTKWLVRYRTISTLDGHIYNIRRSLNRWAWVRVISLSNHRVRIPIRSLFGWCSPDRLHAIVIGILPLIDQQFHYGTFPQTWGPAIKKQRLPRQTSWLYSIIFCRCWGFCSPTEDSLWSFLPS